MSEKFLNSPGLLLDDLSKKMLYGLDHYPMLAMKHEKMEYFCDRFQLLFNGDYRPVKLQAAMLHSCVLQYCECILAFVKDNSVSLKNDEVGYLRRWLSVLENLGGVDSIKNKLIYFKPILEYIIFKDVPSWVVKEFMLHLNRLFETSTQFIFGKKEKKFLFRMVESWLKLIMTCGDYEFQFILVEAILSTCEFCHIKEILVRNFGEGNSLTIMFLKVFGKQNYINDLKAFLTTINGNFHQARSVPCLKVMLEKTVIPPLTGTNGDETWMHINFGFQNLSFECQRDSLRSLPASINSFNSYEFVSVNFKDVDRLCLMKNNDSKMVNPVGGIFLIYVAGKCSCRFDSSKDVVSSIKKITFTVSDGSHLEYLSDTFVKLFGRRFKIANRIPVKKRTFYDKRDSSLNSSTSNSSFRDEKRRRRRKKHNDLILTNLKLENSFTLENKENVPEGTQDCSQNSTESFFKKPVDYKKRRNSQLLTPPTIRLTTKSVNNKIMFPDNKFMNDSRSYFTDKSKVKRGRGTTKNNLSLLKSWNIDTLTTSKNKEMPAPTEEMTIPSNYKFGEENSLAISEANKSEILDFINEELNSISYLQSPLDLKNKSSEVKTPKTESSSIADSSPSLNNKISSNNWLSTEDNREHSESDRLMFPDTITHEFSTDKSNGYGERGTTKNNLSLLKSWDIDILTTSKNKEMPESFKISLVAPTEEMTIPSNYKFGEENSLAISEENKSEIIDFINEELNSIPDLESSLDLKYKSSNVEAPKTESSGIADSNAKLQAKLSSEDSQLNVISEMTSKSKNDTDFVISNNPLKHLPKSRKENRRTEKKESIDTSKTVGRLLRSSVKVNEFMNDTKSNLVNKSKGKATTKKNVSLIKSLDIDILTTLKNKEKISPLVVATTEENSLAILEKNKSDILDFINKELNSIPDLQSPLDVKNKSRKGKTLKGKNSGSAKLQGKSSNKDSRLKSTTEKKASIDKSKTVGRLLRSSVKKVCEAPGLKNKGNENRKKSIKIDHSYSCENTEEIGNVEVISKKETKKHSSTDDDDITEFLGFDNLNPISKASSLKELSQKNATKNYPQDDSETPDIDLILAYSTKNITSQHKNTNEKNLDEEVIEIIDDDETEEMSNADISIISISSTEETIENRQYYDLAVTTVDPLKQVASENNKDKTSTSSTEGSISGTELDTATGKTKTYDVAKTNADAQKDIPEKHEDTDDRVTISIPSDEATGINDPDTDIEEIQTLAINDIITNDHCYASNRAPMLEMANETKNNELIRNYSETSENILSEHNYSSAEKTAMAVKDNDTDIGELQILATNDIIANDHCYASKSASNKSNCSPGSVDDISVPKELPQLADVPILLNEIDYREKASRESTEELKNSCHSIKSKSIKSGFIVRNKSKIASPFHSKTNRSHMDRQLLKEKYTAAYNDLQESKNQVTRLYAELARKRQKVEELERINKETLESTKTLKPDKTGRKKTVTSEKKRTKEHISSQSETSNGTFQKSFQENSFPMITEEPDNFSRKRLPDKTAIEDDEKRTKLSRKMHKPEDDNFVKFTLETSPLQFNEPKKSTPTAEKVIEDLILAQGFETIPPLESVKVRKLVQENSLEKVELIDEEFGLKTKQSTVSGNKLKKNIEFDFGDLKLDNGGLFNLIDKPHKLSKKSDKTAEDLCNRTNDIYGFDAIIIGLRAYLKTLKTPVERKKKPQKQRIFKIQWGGTKKAKSKSKKRNFGKLF